MFCKYLRKSTRKDVRSSPLRFGTTRIFPGFCSTGPSDHDDTFRSFVRSFRSFLFLFFHPVSFSATLAESQLEKLASDLGTKRRLAGPSCFSLALSHGQPVPSAPPGAAPFWLGTFTFKLSAEQSRLLL